MIGHSVLKDMAAAANGRYLPNIVYECNACGKKQRNIDGYLPVDGNHNSKKCFDCASRVWIFCKKCFKFKRNYCYCSGLPSHDEQGTMYRYDTIPNFETKGSINGVLLGLEFEMYNYIGSTRSSTITKAISDKYSDIVLAKWDGSIRNRSGIEVASHILSVDYLMDNIDRFEELLKLFRSKGFISSIEPTCSGHIHYSDDSVSNKQLVNLIKFFSKNKGLLRIISQRQAVGEYWDLPTRNTVKYGRTFSSPRNSWLNFNNPNTVEHRYPSGISSVNKLLYNVELVQGMMEFGKEILGDEDADEFRNYIGDNKNQYPNLWRYISRVRDNL